MVVNLDELIEAALLLQEVEGGRLGGCLLQRQVHAFVARRRGSWLAVASPIGIDGMVGAIALALQEEDHRVVGTHRGVHRRLLAADAGGRNVRVKRQRY
jgi:hypothetical protein